MTDEGISIEDKLIQSKNAQSPIVMIDDGIKIEVRPLLPEKASRPIDVTLKSCLSTGHLSVKQYPLYMLCHILLRQFYRK